MKSIKNSVGGWSPHDEESGITQDVNLDSPNDVIPSRIKKTMIGANVILIMRFSQFHCFLEIPNFCNELSVDELNYPQAKWRPENIREKIAFWLLGYSK